MQKINLFVLGSGIFHIVAVLLIGVLLAIGAQKEHNLLIIATWVGASNLMNSFWANISSDLSLYFECIYRSNTMPEMV